MDLTVVRQSAASAGNRPDAAPPATATAGSQVVVGHIPAPRRGFQPRPGLLTELSQPARRAPAVLTGVSGSGKTELAAAYARARLAAGWRLVAWLDAQDGRGVLTGLVAVADALGLSDGQPRPAADTGRLVRQWLEADGSGCLLVFDDAQDPDVLRPFVPAAGAARVVITSAHEQMSQLGARVPVGAFSAEEAVALLGGRTGRADESGAAVLAAELAHLPLALDLAAAVIARQHLAYDEVLAGRHEQPGEPERPYPRAVIGAVQLSVDTACAADPLGVCTAVMELVALLSRAGVRRDVLHAAGQAGTLLGRGRRVAAAMVDQAVQRLHEQCLLGFSLDGRVVTMHGLVAQVVRDDMKRRGRFAASYRAAAASLELSSEALGPQHAPAVTGDLLGQVIALLEHGQRPGDDAAAGLLPRLRLLALHDLVGLGGSLPEAITIGEPLAAELGRRLGPGHRDTIRAQHDLARAYREAGQLDRAIPLLERAVAAEEELLGADHPSILVSRNELGSAYRAAGRPAAAVAVFEVNVAVCERSLGAMNPKTVASRHSLQLARQESAQAGSA